ncbi:BCD family MFS transporter [Xylophilus sp. ASV27]|uniref:BCD family MFS transporter n=1 Tax=Xylophilus sp. ASV27 TaxID=2795129 RepID=UPI0018ECD72D|nr:BCD family MFS transporter [Xylophilus sp. ASV27]
MKTDFGWPAILRLGLVQACLGAVVVLTTSTLNRVMVVELALPALLPGALVALHYLVQVVRPRMGHGSDSGGRRTPWIIGGMALLGAGGFGAACATALMASHPFAGVLAAVLAFAVLGIGVSAAGTSLLVLLAQRVEASQRASAATTVWLMMIAGFAITAGVAGSLLDPFSPSRLMAVSAAVSIAAFVLTCVAINGIEGGAVPPGTDPAPLKAAAAGVRFREALAQVWAEPAARRFTLFVFISMLAYSAQDLILEPFAGSALGFTPGESTRLSGIQHAGVLLGMVAAALAGRGRNGQRFGSLRSWQIGGCLVSAVALLGLVAAGMVGTSWPFKANVFLLGAANGAFSIAAIAAMMALASEGRASREGVRMGLWGAAQAVAFGLGGLLGTAASDLARAFIGTPGMAYAAVFAAEAALFVVAAGLAGKVGREPASRPVSLSVGEAGLKAR